MNTCVNALGTGLKRMYATFLISKFPKKKKMKPIKKL